MRVDRLKRRALSVREGQQVSEPSKHLTVRPEELLGPLNEVELKNAPKVLYLAGDPGLFRAGPRVSIVGSRAATAHGMNRAERLTRELVARGAVVVSGVAEGIDAVAHRAAIRYGGKTIGVLGTPLDSYYPESNRALQQELMREHLVVSQFASTGSAKNFPMRNRTMALISDTTVIVEAGESSGTMHQGWEALRLGRLLFLLESLAAQKHAWTEELLAYGAQVLSDENFRAFLDALPERSMGEELAF